MARFTVRENEDGKFIVFDRHEGRDWPGPFNYRRFAENTARILQEMADGGENDWIETQYRLADGQEPDDDPSAAFGPYAAGA